MDDEARFSVWAVDAAAQVVAHVERHGVPISWSEAHERILTDAGRGPVRLIEADENGEEHTLCNPLGWEHPDFLESVAAGCVHWHGRPFRPTRADSEVPVGVATAAVVETLSRLSFLLQRCLDTPRCLGFNTGDLAMLVTTLGYFVGDDLLSDLSEGPIDDRLDDSDYILLAAREVSAAINFLEAGEPLLIDAQHLAAPLPRPLSATLLDVDAHRHCVLALRWWLGCF